MATFLELLTKSPDLWSPQSKLCIQNFLKYYAQSPDFKELSKWPARALYGYDGRIKLDTVIVTSPKTGFDWVIEQTSYRRTGHLEASLQTQGHIKVLPSDNNSCRITEKVLHNGTTKKLFEEYTLQTGLGQLTVQVPWHPTLKTSLFKWLSFRHSYNQVKQATFTNTSPYLDLHLWNEELWMTLEPVILKCFQHPDTRAWVFIDKCVIKGCDMHSFAKSYAEYTSKCFLVYEKVTAGSHVPNVFAICGSYEKPTVHSDDHGLGIRSNCRNRKLHKSLPECKARSSCTYFHAAEHMEALAKGDPSIKVLWQTPDSAVDFTSLVEALKNKAALYSLKEFDRG